MAKQPAPAAPPPRRSLLARLRERLPAFARNRYAAFALAIGAVALIGILIGTAALFRGNPAANREILLAEALSRLDAGEFQEARELATTLRELQDASSAERGAALYILGGVVLHEAEQHPQPDQRHILYLVASRYLEEAHIHGFPAGREADGLLQLARALNRSARHAPALPILQEALSANPDRAAELRRLLAESSLYHRPPKLVQALAHVRSWLAMADLQPGERQAALLLEGRVLLGLGKIVEAQASLATIPADSPALADAVMLRAEAALQAARQARAQGPDLPEPIRQSLVTAVAALESLSSTPNVDREQLPPAQLFVGQCREMLGDRRAAAAHFDRLRRARFGRPEGTLATLFLAEFAREEGRPEEALEHYLRAIQQAGPRETYQNPWLPWEELEARLEAANADLVRTGHYSAAIAIAAAMAPLAPEETTLRLQVAAHEAWAQKLLEQADTQTALQAEVTRAEARGHFRQAGAQGERLAALRLATRHYVDDLARAGQHFQQGQGFRQAVRVYREFLRQNPPERVPESLVGLGESLLALGETDEALASLARCRDDFPSHPATYRARLLESRGWQEKGDLARAKDLLLENLYRHALTPKSSDWRDALYALGQLLYREACELETKSRVAGINALDPELKKDGLKLLEQSYATFQEAVHTLTEAVQRYPTAAQAVQARYWIAESYRHAAIWPRKKLTVTSIETSRLALNRQIQQELDAALVEYQSLIADLSNEQTLERRTPVEVAMLRNCYFGRADALFDLGRYEEAIRAYSDATNRYQHDPESLEAYVQIATCYRRLRRPNEARGTLEQARVVLQRIKPDADFLRTTRLDRQQWSDLLSWLRTL